MVMINKLKKDNLAVLLADGFEIGSLQNGNLSYQDISGLLSGLLGAIRQHRNKWTEENGDLTNERILACDPEQLKATADRVRNRNSFIRTAVVKRSDAENDDHLHSQNEEQLLFGESSVLSLGPPSEESTHEESDNSGDSLVLPSGLAAAFIGKCPVSSRRTRVLPPV